MHVSAPDSRFVCVNYLIFNEFARLNFVVVIVRGVSMLGVRIWTSELNLVGLRNDLPVN